MNGMFLLQPDLIIKDSCGACDQFQFCYALRSCVPTSYQERAGAWCRQEYRGP